MNKKPGSLLLLLLMALLPALPAGATKLASCSTLDQDYLWILFKDGEVEFKDDGKLAKPDARNSFSPDDNQLKRFGLPLATAAAAETGAWTLTSSDDKGYGPAGLTPTAVYRATKVDSVAQEAWDKAKKDWSYETSLRHELFLKLPKPLKRGMSYTLKIGEGVHSDQNSVSLKYDFDSNISEAIHVNLVGYESKPGVKGADLYYFMGDGAYRDYSSFEGKPVALLNTRTKKSQVVGRVSFGKKAAAESKGHNLTGGDVWHVDFSGAHAAPGSYRLVVEGIGCSQDFAIGPRVYRAPFEVSTRGYFYMRIGQDSPDMTPKPRTPLWIPGKSPKGTKVVITTMHPYHKKWKTFSHGDAWDRPEDWSRFAKPGRPENPRGTGGHSDALDWDRHLGHVSNIYDMLLPYILTEGKIGDDDLGIAESGNGIPDIIDEARNEVDFWLNLRDGEGYSHGLTNPDDKSTLYQAGNTPMAAWASALNAGMLAESLRIAGQKNLAEFYTQAAADAYAYASKNPGLDLKQDLGYSTVRGQDMKMMAAAYLYRLTGDTAYENAMKETAVVTGPDSEIKKDGEFDQLWGVAAYLTTRRKINYPELHQNMKKAVVYQAKMKEANFSRVRPSRRSTDDLDGYFINIQNVQRTIVAHAVADSGDKAFFKDALLLEADWGLGRNPINTIQMTAATTSLASKRHVENAYTSGWNDGTPGVHPGHTPYWNLDDWAPGMTMGRPSWLASFCYPEFSKWPRASADFNARYLWAYAEFTPQQTMRGKAALYGYLYGLEKAAR